MLVMPFLRPVQASKRTGVSYSNGAIKHIMLKKSLDDLRLLNFALNLFLNLGELVDIPDPSLEKFTKHVETLTWPSPMEKTSSLLFSENCPNTFQHESVLAQNPTIAVRLWKKEDQIVVPKVDTPQNFC